MLKKTSVSSVNICSAHHSDEPKSPTEAKPSSLLPVVFVAHFINLRQESFLCSVAEEK
jgi:hypothetical protein